jgi:eight-cysteine-cluster-containing protein
MPALTWIGRLAVVAMTVGIVLEASAQRAQACTCLPPTVESSYNGSSDVIRARILRRSQGTSTTRYIARVQRVFKGCLEEAQLVVLTTPSSSAACGALLSTNRDYLINGDAAGTLLGLPRLDITLCDYNLPWVQLTQHDRDFLNGRMVCCGDDCQCADGSAPVSCFVDPCEVAAPCPDGKCVANYCGGCNAEFYDESGYAVCGGSCASNADCAEGEYCSSDNSCVADGSCRREIDCNLEGNDYPHIECVGHGVCDGATCGWECESPQCVDLLGFDFGPCDAVLGVGVIDGQCSTISGCSAEPFQLFETLEECRRTCGAECGSAADCMVTGCSGQVCAAEPVFTTCEWLPEYACYHDPEITTCGCSAGLCAWDDTPKLAACLEAGGP